MISFGFVYSISVFFIFIFIEYVWYLNFKNKKNYKSFWSENLFIKEYWLRSFNFTGKTRRKDFWFASFQIFIIYFLIGIPFLAITISSIYSSKDPISTSNEFNQIVSFFSWSFCWIIWKLWDINDIALDWPILFEFRTNSVRSIIEINRRFFRFIWD